MRAESTLETLTRAFDALFAALEAFWLPLVAAHAAHTALVAAYGDHGQLQYNGYGWAGNGRAHHYSSWPRTF